jgi:hypothetical protein
MARKEKSTQKPALPPPDLDIDLGAALPPTPEPKRGRGRPALPGGPKPKPRNPNRKVRKDKGISKKAPNQFPYIDNNILVSNNIIRRDDIRDIDDKGDWKSAEDLKNQMSLKELEFIGLHFTGDHGILKSMKLAGYEAANDSYLYLLAKKIINKYEAQTGDHRIIARALGAGEVFVLSGLMELAKNGKSEIVKRAALGDLAKILGLTKEQIDGAQGITIIFEGGNQPGSAALALPASSSDEPVQPTRVLQITK